MLHLSHPDTRSSGCVHSVQHCYLCPRWAFSPGTQCSSISPRGFPTSGGKTPCLSGHASRGCLMCAFIVVLFLSGLGTQGGISWQSLQCSSPGPCSCTKPKCSSRLILHKNSYRYVMLDLLLTQDIVAVSMMETHPRPSIGSAAAGSGWPGSRTVWLHSSCLLVIV